MEEAADTNKEGMSICNEKDLAKPVWEVLTMSLKTLEPAGRLCSQKYMLLLWAFEKKIVILLISLGQ